MFEKISTKWLSFFLAVVMIVSVLPMGVFSEGGVTNYADFMSKLKQLEVYADEYAAQTYRDSGELVLNFIRTGVERYQDDNWTTLAGQEITGFTSYVEAQDAEKGTAVMDLRDIVTDDFKLPNGNPVDFGHMFGTMNISYLSSGSADLSGWAGDLCDLLYYCVEQENVPSGTVDEMAAYILEKCFGVDADDAFGWDDFYGDMDAYYIISEYKNGAGSFSAIMDAYFTADLDDADRAVYFVNNRFGVEDTKEAVRKAIYDSYSADVGIKVLEAGRGLSSYNALREACCYALADYFYRVAGGQGLFVPGSSDSDEADNDYYSVFSTESSVLAPGITQDIKYAQTVDGKQIVYYVATVDITRDDVTIMTTCNDNDPSSGWGLQKVEDQVAALVADHKDRVDENGNKIYENFSAVVATNGDGYNITNGTPSGLVVMEGQEWHAVGNGGFFAILNDGSAVIGTKDDYNNIYKGQVKEGMGGFGGFGSILVKDGKINVTKNANYTGTRGSRTAIGIKEDGSVVMVALDGRQLPFSAGGAMEELAQIMIDAGCVSAINLDGGGSTTYLSKPAGSDELELINRPSDGYARSVSNSLVAISTAKPSNEFDHAIISSDYEYITAGTSMQINVTGVSNTGNSAAIPAGAYWQVSDESIGTITSEGMFTAVANGDVTVQYIVNGEVVGSKVIHVVIPDDIKFVEDRITAIYGVAKEIEVTVWYKGSPVAFTPLKDAFVFFDYEFDEYGNPKLYFTSDAGYIDGLKFVGNDDKGIRTANVYAALLIGKNIVAVMGTINMYYPDEALFDFENATQGNRKLAWNRIIENAKTADNQLYRISDPDSPVEIDYTFALDMTTIDIPAQLEPLKSMLPTYQEDATAWTYLLQLAERVCVQTNVTIRAEFSKDLKLDISELKVINDYFTLTAASVDENNVLTIVCNWVNQTQPIDAATANPLCILAGLKATVKDNAAYYNNEVLIANNGSVTYDIYLAASSLYNFAQDAENQANFGLYPYIHEDDCRSDFSDSDEEESAANNNDKGAHFTSQYVDFADIYVLNNEIRQGWHEEDGDYYYYVDNEPVTGVQLVTNRHDATQMRFYEFDDTGKLVSEQGTTGLITFNGDLYYAVLGVAQTGWQVYNDNNYYFDPDTGKAVNGVYTIKEKMNPAVADGKYTPMVEYTYTFTDYVLTRGYWVYDKNIYGNDGKYHTGWRYRWAGDWKDGWFEVDGEYYYAHKDYPNMTSAGYVRIMKQNAASSSDTQYHLLTKDEKGALQKEFTGVYFDGTNYAYLINGVRRVNAGLYEDNGYYYYINNSTGNLYVNQTNLYVPVTNGLVPVGNYNFDSQGRLSTPLVTVDEIGADFTHTVIGRVLTLEHSIACKVGYLKDGKYVAIEATDNGDGTYKFVVPKDVSAVTVVVAGDVSGDGVVDANDNKALAASLMPEAAALTGAALLAADVNGNGEVNSADRTLIARSMLDKSHNMYQALEW